VDKVGGESGAGAKKWKTTTKTTTTKKKMMMETITKMQTTRKKTAKSTSFLSLTCVGLEVSQTDKTWHHQRHQRPRLLLLWVMAVTLLLPLLLHFHLKILLALSQ
jgi:hypothetical protein